MRTREEIIWAAGLFEGEGSITTAGLRGMQFKLKMTDWDAVDKFASAIGIGFVRGPYHNLKKTKSGNAHKDYWEYCLCNFEHVQAAIAMVYPWLCARRKARAIELLTKHISLSRSAMYNCGHVNREKTHCPFGHEYTEENTYRHYSQHKNGKRYTLRMCRICLLDRNKKYKAKRRAMC